MSAHARYAARTAAALGYCFRSLDGADGYLFEVSDGARRAVFAAGAGSPYAMNDVRAASIARDKEFCAAVLGGAEVPVLPGRKFFVTGRWSEMRTPGREPEDALAFARDAAFPLFCKPVTASNGLYAEVIDNAAGFADYMARVAREHFAILVQPFVRGAEYRVLVLEGRALCSYRKTLPGVTGDGAATLGELAPGSGMRARAHDRTGALYRSGDVVPEGVIATLDGPANRAAGGGASDLRDGAPPALARLAQRAAAAIGLRLAGVDLFDLSPGCDLSRLAIIEVNSNPMIATLEDHGRWDLIEAVWRANFAAAMA